MSELHTPQEIEDSSKVEIIVNAEPKTVETDTVSYERVVELAFPNPPSPDTTFTVTFRKAKEPHEGSLVAGHSVVVRREGTIFNVKATGRS